MPSAKTLVTADPLAQPPANDTTGFVPVSEAATAELPIETLKDLVSGGKLRGKWDRNAGLLVESAGVEKFQRLMPKEQPTGGKMSAAFAVARHPSAKHGFHTVLRREKAVPLGR